MVSIPFVGKVGFGDGIDIANRFDLWVFFEDVLVTLNTDFFQTGRDFIGKVNFGAALGTDRFLLVPGGYWMGGADMVRGICRQKTAGINCHIRWPVHARIMPVLVVNV